MSNFGAEIFYGCDVCALIVKLNMPLLIEVIYRGILMKQYKVLFWIGDL